MKALDVVLLYYEQGDLNDEQVLEFLNNISATPQSKDRFMKRATLARANYRAKIKREQKQSQKENEKATV